MSYKLRYQIEGCYDKDGKKKELEPKVKFGQYFLYMLYIGRSAILIRENDDMAYKTSKVEDIFIWENGIKITTMNTVYYLKPYYINDENESERLY